MSGSEPTKVPAGFRAHKKAAKEKEIIVPLDDSVTPLAEAVSAPVSAGDSGDQPVAPVGAPKSRAAPPSFRQVKAMQQQAEVTVPLGEEVMPLDAGTPSVQSGSPGKPATSTASTPVVTEAGAGEIDLSEVMRAAQEVQAEANAKVAPAPIIEAISPKPASSAPQVASPAPTSAPSAVPAPSARAAVGEPPEKKHGTSRQVVDGEVRINHPLHDRIKDGKYTDAIAALSEIVGIREEDLTDDHILAYQFLERTPAQADLTIRHDSTNLLERLSFRELLIRGYDNPSPEIREVLRERLSAKKRMVAAIADEFCKQDPTLSAEVLDYSGFSKIPPAGRGVLVREVKKGVAQASRNPTFMWQQLVRADEAIRANIRGGGPLQTVKALRDFIGATLRVGFAPVVAVVKLTKFFAAGSWGAAVGVKRNVKPILTTAAILGAGYLAFDNSHTVRKYVAPVINNTYESVADAYDTLAPLVHEGIKFASESYETVGSIVDAGLDTLAELRDGADQASRLSETLTVEGLGGSTEPVSALVERHIIAETTSEQKVRPVPRPVAFNGQMEAHKISSVDYAADMMGQPLGQLVREALTSAGLTESEADTKLREYFNVVSLMAPLCHAERPASCTLTLKEVGGQRRVVEGAEPELVGEIKWTPEGFTVQLPGDYQIDFGVDGEPGVASVLKP